MKKLILATMFALTASASNAVETHSLSTHRSWQSSVDVYDDGDLACGAKTTNGNGSSLELSLSHDGMLTVWVFTGGENGTRFTADVEMHIDYEEWTLQDAVFPAGTRGQTAFWFTFASADTAVEFMADVKDGAFIALKNPGGDGNFATWSLSGSSAAIEAQISCFDKIRD